MEMVGGKAGRSLANRDPCLLSRFLVPQLVPKGTLLSHFARSHVPMREAKHSEPDDLGCPPPSRKHPYQSLLLAQDQGSVQNAWKRMFSDGCCTNNTRP